MSEGVEYSKTPQGDTVVRYALASSTMDKAKELCKEKGGEEWMVVFADQQVSGRGTNGRTWVSPLGNAYMSICVPKSESVLPITRLMYLPLETGIAVLSAVLGCMPNAKALPEKSGVQLSLKWPNDVLLNGRKVSGNLIEDGGSHMIVGIGVNVCIAPQLGDGGRETDCLSNHGATVTAPKLILSIFENLKTNLLSPPTPDPVAPYASHMDWSTTIHERNFDGTRGPEGTPLRLTTHGHLVIRQGTGEKTLINEYLF